MRRYLSVFATAFCVMFAAPAHAASIWTVEALFDSSRIYLPFETVVIEALFSLEPTSDPLIVSNSWQDIDASPLLASWYDIVPGVNALAGSFFLQPGDSMRWTAAILTPKAGIAIPEGQQCCVSFQITLSMPDTSTVTQSTEDVSWNTTTPVPEPATLTLIGSGIAAIIARRHRVTATAGAVDRTAERP